MSDFRRSARDLATLYKTSRSYRRVVVILTVLTLIPLAVGLVEAASVEGCTLGYVIWFLVTVGVSSLLLGLALWAVAMIWYRPTKR
jgi:hypothetical protein